MVDKRMLSTIVVIIVIIASMGTVIAYDANKNNSSTSNVYNILAKVNTAGSGIYINEDAVDPCTSGNIPKRNGAPMYATAEDKNKYTTNECEKAWRGLVVGTPGTTSIQHMQMRALVEEMGLTFQSYQKGDTPSKSDKCVYYIPTITNYDLAMNCSKNNGVTLDMGIIWEYQYSYITTVHLDGAPTFVNFALTQDFFGDHACCVLAGHSNYINTHMDVTIRFLAAYIESVKWIQTVSDNDNSDCSENYQTLITTIVKSVLDSVIKNKKQPLTEVQATKVIENAIANITYCFGDDSDNTYDLHELKKDIAGIIEKDKNSLQRTISSLGFTNSLQFANRFVDDSYLIKASIYKKEDYATTTNITVAVINNDIHWFALHGDVANEIFKKYGISITISTQNNGAGVAVALQNGGAQFGLLGAYPATITAVNGALISI